jgi:hypothetical protein
MDWRQQLARNLSAEAEAYGYTLSVWGGGAILIHRYSMPNVDQVYAYVGGALLGFAVLALLAFRCLFGRREVGEDRQLVVASMLHVVSTLVNLALSHFLVVTTSSTPLPTTVAFAIVGFQVTVGYNLLLLVESFLARIAARLERAITD